MKEKKNYLNSGLQNRLAKLQLLARGSMVGGFTGIHRSPHKGSSVEFSSYRKYVAGDDIGNIDWRVYARTDRFYVKEFEASTNLRCYMLLDCSSSMAFSGSDDSKLEFAKKIVANLANILIYQGDSVGLQLFNDDFITDLSPKTSPKHLHTIFELLNENEAEGETNLPKVLHTLADKIGQRALVVIISDFFSDVEDLLKCFDHFMFKNHDVAVFHILDKQELEFDIVKPTRFVDLENSASSISVEPAMMKQQYLDRLNDYLAKLEVGCYKRKVDYNRISPQDSLEDFLSYFILKRYQGKG